MTKKDKKIIEDAERAGIPIFVFTAKDILSIEILNDYYNQCLSVLCEENHTNGIIERIDEFQSWQNNNPEKVKLPD